MLQGDLDTNQLPRTQGNTAALYGRDKFYFDDPVPFQRCRDCLTNTLDIFYNNIYLSITISVIFISVIQVPELPDPG